MKCPKCKKSESKVLESRSTQEGQAIRRRRECLACDFRYSTYEQVEILDLTIVKRDGRRETYSFEKLYKGLERAFEKRAITEKSLKRFAENVEREIQKKTKNGEIKSSVVGQIVMKKIKRKDPVAYLRFASVYLNFNDVGDFKNALKVFPAKKLDKKNYKTINKS